MEPKKISGEVKSSVAKEPVKKEIVEKKAKKVEKIEKTEIVEKTEEK
jgi:hypothetical protein